MNTAVCPIGGTFNITVFDGIVMDVIYMTAEILIITNPMFPKSPLPYRLLTFMTATGKHGGAIIGCNLLGKRPLDITPTD